MTSLRLFLVLALFAAPAFARAAEKAKTIDELATMFDSSSCKECHGAIYAQWEKSHHARPMMGVAGGLMLTPVVLSSPFKVDDPKQATLRTFPCLKCHLPQALRWAEDAVAQELAAALMANPQDKAKVAKLQITCKVCHWEKGIIHRLQDGAPAAGVLYGAHDVAAHEDKVYKQVKKNPVFTQAIFCGQCHGTGPNFEFENPVQCATLYGSYQHSYIPAGGTKSCQECHMALKDGVADHLIPPNFDDKASTQSILAETIDLDVQTLGYQWLLKAGTLVPKVVVNTKITHRAGHRIPDG